MTKPQDRLIFENRLNGAKQRYESAFGRVLDEMVENSFDVNGEVVIFFDMNM